MRRSHTLMSQPTIDVKPIAKEELVPQYVEKLKDNEIGFRREFEVCFTYLLILYNFCNH